MRSTVPIHWNSVNSSALLYSSELFNYALLHAHLKCALTVHFTPLSMLNECTVLCALVFSLFKQNFIENVLVEQEHLEVVTEPAADTTFKRKFLNVT